MGESKIVDLIGYKEERITPEEFLLRQQKNARSARNAKFIPPELGDPHFGYFLISSNNPYYRFNRK